MKTYSIPFSEGDEISPLVLEADFYSCSDSVQTGKKNKAVLYFHGGGLVCGSRKDLPGTYIQMFLQAGYDFLAFDYPLAPEYSVSRIIKSCLASVAWFQEHYQDMLGLDSPDYFLFGRSSGAYLIFQLAAAIQALSSEASSSEASFSKATPSAISPSPLQGLLAFYGYPSLEEGEFSRANPYYVKNYPPISRETAFTALHHSPVLDSLKSPRLLLYLYARQEGSWMELLGREEERKSCSLSREQLISLPPAFLTASSTDPDVPFGISKRAAKAIPGSRFYPVYNMGHDFDQDASLPQGRQVYEECLKWMESL